ncbi:DUF4164 family protein [Candidatus Anaplasma sp. TIGMIC]|uniref:DUF4164 family protein n=1 Tax=Candidatus Anaplasma sp. TIGMIC TaxID=3020713 RepID=UPI00232C93B9|nr:DUF4164 family protein [Candidatus Anaplasma sp. TIGMIC]MDB1135208.1 DUF4164 family protein [Candidatus Anaplasma sp. TIGMIC]
MLLKIDCMLLLSVITCALGFWFVVALKVGDIEEYAEDLRRSLSRLQSSLAARFESGAGEYSGSQVLELRKRVDELAERNAGLENELQSLKAACSGWRATCVELVDRLGASVELVSSIVSKGINSGSDE